MSPPARLEWPISTVNEDTKMGVFKACAPPPRAMLIPNVHLAVENLAPRQQPAETALRSTFISPGLAKNLRLALGCLAF